MMHGREKSDSAIVAGKPTNKAGQPAAEPVEPRAEAKGNASQQSTRRTQSRVSVSHTEFPAAKTIRVRAATEGGNCAGPSSAVSIGHLRFTELRATLQRIVPCDAVGD
jgi:hypothetical protein